MADEQMLPPEYQAEIEAANRKRMLAQLLQKQAMGFQGAQQTGRIAPKTSPLAWLANAATGYMGSQADAKGAQSIADIRNRAGEAQRGEIAALMAAPEEQQFAQGQQGKFSQTQALAKLLQEQRMKLREKRGDILGRNEMPDQALAALEGKPVGPLPQPVAPVFSTTQGPNGPIPTVVNTGKGGRMTGGFGAPGVNITNVPAGQEGKMSLDILEGGLKERQPGADAAKNTYTAAARAVDALQRGAEAGGGGDIKQNIRMALQAFGVNAPATAETNELQMALDAALLTEAQKIKPVSNTDIDTLKRMVGSIATDPQALARSLAFVQSLALRGMQDYGRYIDEQNATVTNPIAKQRLAGTKIGYEMPSQLSGPVQHQLEVMRNLKAQGVDISNFRDDQGKPFPENFIVNVNPAGGYPTAARTLPKPSAKHPPPANGKAYTVEEFQRIFGPK